MASNSDEEMEMMGYMSTGGGDPQAIYIANNQQRETNTEAHLNGELQQDELHNVSAVSDRNRDNSDYHSTQDDSALGILASMSVGSRVPQSVIEAASSGKSGQCHDIQMEWFVEFSWLELEEMTLKLYCRYCKYFDPCGIFSVGKLAARTRYEDMKKHASSEPHRRCLQMHTEQFPDTVLHIQQGTEIQENLTKITPQNWSILFPWMQHDKATDTLFCQPCQQDGMSGNLVAGVERSQINMSEIEEHEQLVSHRTAVVQHKRRHLATLATPTESVTSPRTVDTLGPVSVEVSKAKRKRGRPKKYPPRYIILSELPLLYVTFVFALASFILSICDCVCNASHR